MASLVLELGLALLSEGCHAFFAIMLQVIRQSANMTGCITKNASMSYRSEGGVEEALLVLKALLQRNLVGYDKCRKKPGRST
jgi:hypothetical protein